jgi:CBS domain containing-hemolysin-like protein
MITIAVAPSAGGSFGEATRGDVWLLLMYLAMALGVSFLCSMLEAGILSVPRAHVAVLIRRGRPSGRLLARLKDNIDRPLSAILTLNTVAHTIGAAGVGAQAYVVFQGKWVMLTSVVLTAMILVFSEIIPKTIGAVYARPLAPMTARVTQILVIICYPLVVAFESMGRLIGPRGQAGSRMSREEVISVAELGASEGALANRESHVIRNLLQMRQIRVKDIMTPRPVVEMHAASMTVGQLMETSRMLRFARMPVYGDGPDDLRGLVHRYDLLNAYRNGEVKRRLGDLAEPLTAIPETANVAYCLEQFIERQVQMFQVVDEYGGTEGIVTFEDAVETLLGVEIVDETDSVEDMRKVAADLAARRYRRIQADRRAL